MPIDSRLMNLSFTADTIRAVIPAIASISTKKALKPKPQTYCTEFASYASNRLSRLDKYESPIDNREMAFTITVETAKSLIDAMDNFLGVQMWEKQERLCNDAKVYLEVMVKEMPELPTQLKLKV